MGLSLTAIANYYSYESLRTTLISVQKSSLSRVEMSKALEKELDKLEKLNENPDQKLNIPVKTDGTTFELLDLKDTQRQIMTYILRRFLEWTKRNSKRKRNTETMTEKQINQYEYHEEKLTRMTISGAGGTGKSVLIKTLITAIRRMFNCNDVAFVGAPTGSTGHNAGGETNHKLFAINSRTGEVANKKKDILIRRLMNALFVVIDERSMCDCYQLGIIENNCRNYAFKGRNKHLSFGGIPFVIVIGDDFQLPPVDPDAFHALESKIPSKIKNKKHPNVILLYNNGRRMFKYLGEDSWSLQRKHRILDNETQLEKTLLGVRERNIPS